MPANIITKYIRGTFSQQIISNFLLKRTKKYLENKQHRPGLLIKYFYMYNNDENLCTFMHKTLDLRLIPSYFPQGLKSLCSTGVKSRVVLDDRQKSRLQNSIFLAWKEYYKILVLYPGT